MVRPVPDSHHAPRPDWDLLAVAVALVGGIIGVVLALAGIGP
jgi:hypothetical protein